MHIGWLCEMMLGKEHRSILRVITEERLDSIVAGVS
jgi:hypothetical protein